MNFLKKLFGVKDKVTITSKENFWDWFAGREKEFFAVVKKKERIDALFLSPLMLRLQQLNKQFYCLTGMTNENTAELIITAEGDIKNFVFVEELVAAAPLLNGWKFTALKPASGVKDISVEMNGYTFNSSTISFFSNEDPQRPDKIDINLVHSDFSEANKKTIINGSFIYLDSVLGELNTAVLIDEIKITGRYDDQPTLIPMDKLSDFLLWREKEFVEKYQGTRYNTGNDTHSVFEGKDKKGNPSVGIINHELLTWDATPSHPWMLMIEIKYDGKSRNGMPGKETQALMTQFEEELTAQLPDHAGYLNLGRETYNSIRTIYFACNEFRNASKATHAVATKYADKLNITYDIFKDKYWVMMDKFKQVGQ